MFEIEPPLRFLYWWVCQDPVPVKNVEYQQDDETTCLPVILSGSCSSYNHFPDFPSQNKTGGNFRYASWYLLCLNRVGPGHNSSFFFRQESDYAVSSRLFWKSRREATTRR